jgi:hypothetical protein
MEHSVMEFKAKSTAWGGCNLWKNNEVEFFDLTGENGEFKAPQLLTRLSPC